MKTLGLTLLRYLTGRKEGATFAEIARQIQPPLPRRSVQRWLAALAQVGVLNHTGTAQSSRYSVRRRPGVLGTITWRDGSTPTASPDATATSAPKSPPSKTSTTAAPTVATAGPARKAQNLDVQSSMLDVGRSASLAPSLPTVATIPAARVQPLLDQLLPNLLRQQIAPDRLANELKLPAVALFALKPGENVDDLITLVMAALDQLTPEQAAQYGCSRESFVTWREIVWPADSALHPTPYVPLPPLVLAKPMAPERLALFLREVAHVVTHGITPAQLHPYLETQKAWLRGDETIDDWVAVLTAELNRLRVEDAVQRHIRPEAYRLWRKQAWPMTR